MWDIVFPHFISNPLPSSAIVNWDMTARFQLKNDIFWSSTNTSLYRNMLVLKSCHLFGMRLSKLSQNTNFWRQWRNSLLRKIYWTGINLAVVNSRTHSFISSLIAKWNWVFACGHWCEENEMLFRFSCGAISNHECQVKTIEWSSPTSGGEQWAFLNILKFIEVKKTILN